MFFYQDFVDVALEAGRGIKKTEKYDLVLEIAVLYLEGCFSLITFTNFHLIICVCQVQLNKTLGTTQAIKRLANQRQRVAILDCQVIESLIIYAQAEATVFFLNKWYRSTGRGLGKSDETAGQVGFNVSFQYFKLHWL